MSTEIPSAPLTGYATSDQFIATRKKMGGRWVIHIDMSISQLVLGIEAPPVGVPQVDNREVILSRCNDFATYVDESEKWGSPSLMLWCPEGILSFDPIDKINDLIPQDVQVGVLQVPRNSRLSIRILDGQHRIKGFHIWIERANQQLAKAKEHLERAKAQGEPALISDAKKQVQKAQATLERTQKENIGVDLLIVNTAEEAKQMFADIANHAKGMNKSLTTNFDSSKIINRVTTRLVDEDPVELLQGRVDWNKDRLSGKNPNFLSAKAVADITRATLVGVNGRVSKQQERNEDSTQIYDNAKRFFDAIAQVFPELVTEDPRALREQTLMASGTILRVLAGVWHEVTGVTSDNGVKVKPRMTDTDFREFLMRLKPYMNAPVKAGSPWLSTGYFPPVPDDSSGVMAPSSRSQDLRGLSELMRDWALRVKPMPFEHAA